MAGFDDDYYRENGDFDDAGNSDVESSPDDYYDNSYFQPDEVNHPLRLNGKEIGGNDKRKSFHTRREAGKNALKDGEKSASKKPNINGRGGDKSTSLGEKEKNVDSDNSTAGKIKNSVKGAQEIKSGHFIKGMGKIKKSGPLGIIVAGLLLFSGFSFLGQSSMGFSLMSLLQGNFADTSMFTRSNKLTKWQLHPRLRNTSSEADDFVQKHSKIFQKFTGKNEKYFKMSKKQRRKFNKYGISVEKSKDFASGDYVMRFVKGNGDELIAVADPDQVGDNRRLLSDLLDSEPEFAKAYDDGTMTWRKAVSNWFDKKASNFLEHIKVGRNRFKDYKADGDDNEQKVSDYESTMKNATGDGDIEGKTGTETDVKTSEDGEATLNLKKGSSPEEVEETVKNFAGEEGVGGKISKMASKVAQGACTVSEIIGAINMLVIANEATQILQVASTVFEGIQKAQVEDSKETPINEINNSLTKKKKATYQTANGETIEKSGSAMSAASITALFGNTATNINDPSINSFNLTDSISNIMDALGSNMEAFKTCTFAKLGAGMVETVLDIADFAKSGAEWAACIMGGWATFGASCGPLIADCVVKVGASWAISELIGRIVSSIVEFMVPKIVTMLARDLATDIGGEDFGNAIASGANMYMGQNHQYGGGSLTSKENFTAYLQERDKYIANEAKYERLTRSPFDVTSPYTFLGSLVTKMVPFFASSTSSITGSITNFSNITMNSIASITPNASAMTSAITAQEAANATAEHCPELDSIGAVGDAFCNPYFVTDYSTMDEDPAEIANKVNNLSSGQNFDNSKTDTDVPVINENPDTSNLYRYIIFCGQRSGSTFGMADQNIANAIDSGPSALESSIPVYGGIADMFQAEKHINNLGLISGESCVAKDSDKSLGSEAFTWDEAKYYQRFVEDQRLAENMGLVEESSVSVALRHYYEKNPIDTSYEGTLAYYSGMTKEKVIDTLDMMEGMVWIAGYDPSDLYPYKTNVIAIETKGEEKQQNVGISVETIIIPKIAYVAYRKEYNIA